jgi:thioredoxin reductase (NADPH)
MQLYIMIENKVKTSDDLRGATALETTSMNNAPRGLPLTRSHVEQIFPKLTPAQIRRIAARGHMRALQHGEVLYEQGVTAVPFFVVVSGELEVVRPLGAAAVETLVTVYGSGQFSGEVGTLSGRRTLPRTCH